MTIWQSVSAPVRWTTRYASTWLNSAPKHGHRSFANTALCSAKAPKELLALKSLDDETHHRLAREWVDGFCVEDIPKGSYETTYARSSGPGGQHVNTTSSKAVVRLPLQPALGSWLPKYVLVQLANTSHYLPSPPTLLVSSQTTRFATQNAEAALKVLHATLLAAARAPIQGATSEQQKERVKGLAAAEKARKKVMKEKKSSSKASRRGDF